MNIDYKKLGRVIHNYLFIDPTNWNWLHDYEKERFANTAEVVIEASGLLEAIEELNITIDMITNLAIIYETKAKELKDICNCHDCGCCAAQLRYEDMADELRIALRGP